MKTLLSSLLQSAIRVCGVAMVCAAAAPGPLGAQTPVAHVQPRITAQITDSEQTALQGTLHPFARPENDAGRMPGGARLNGISLYFSRSAAQQADLEALLAAQQNPSSPQYHQWLTPDQYAARFGMAQSDIDKVQSWLQRQGFSIDSVARSHNMIRFSGTVGQVEAAFGTQMHYYNVAGVRHFAPSTALQVPAAIAPVVEAIRNLNDFKARAMHVHAPPARPQPSFTSGQSGNVFFAPGDIRTAYDFPSTQTTDGTGQSIAVVGRTFVNVSDIENFQSAAGLNKKDPTLVLVPGTGDSQTFSGDLAESDLDLEWSAAMAPGANVFLVYVGNNQNADVWDSITYAVDERLANIISVSYGSCEPGISSSFQSSMESVFKQAAAQGQTVFAASGDQGSTSCSDPTNTQVPVATQQQLAVSYPASSVNVTAVGGTEIDQSNAAYYTQGQGYWAAETSGTDIISSALKYIPEVAWNDDKASVGVSPQAGGGLSASGGGVSVLFSKPSWQSALTPKDGKRDVPDVALYSSPDFVAYLFCTSDTTFWSSTQQASCNSGFRDSATGALNGIGGTSVATPIFAGILALINDQGKYVTGQGTINPVLYKLAADSSTYKSAFNDVTSGNNYCLAGTNFNYCSSSGATEGYKAGTGYDQVTGLGSVNVNPLLAAWTNSQVAPSTLVATTTTVSASNSSPNAGAQVTFTVTVAPSAGSGMPTGTVNLSIDGSGTSYGTGNLTPVTLTSNGTVTYTTSFSSTGTHEIIAQYAGDGTYAASAGSASVTIGTTSSGKGSFKLASSPSTLTVSRGSSGSETLTVTPAGGYTGTVLLNFSTSNDSALANLCYGFTNTNSAGQGSVAVGGTAAVTTTLALDTNAADCSSATGGAKPGFRPLRTLMAGSRRGNTPPAPKPNRLPAEAAFAGVLLAGFLGRYARRFRAVAWVLVLAAAGLAMSACGGSSGSNTVSNPGKGTYTINVSAADSVTSSITGSTSFTFTID
jgi:subtilase family serine protease